ncbi:general stress protein [Priestia megaterium]|nr:general stress protein [Priestia megaterium]
MNEQKVMNKLSKILKDNRVGTLATVVGNQPHSRYMTFFSEDDGVAIYTPTNIHTHKADEIEANPNVHILLGYSGEGYGDEYVEVSGTAIIRDDQQLKERLWNEHMSKWFDGPNDPNYVVLEITPSDLRFMNDGESTPTFSE